MFSPIDFDDPAAINRIKLKEENCRSIISGTEASVEYICQLLDRKAAETNDVIVAAFDGYIGAQWQKLIGLVTEDLSKRTVNVEVINFSDFYKTSEELDHLFSENLPADREKDPVLLFGKLCSGSLEDMLDEQKTGFLKSRLENIRSKSGGKSIIIVYGCGCCVKSLRQFFNIVFYFDVAPKNVILRAGKGIITNLGDTVARHFNEFIRRLYYIDYEVASGHRRDLIMSCAFDFYVDDNDSENIKLVPAATFNAILSSLVKYPVRCKPVYLEGVWGGQYFKKLRNLPPETRNCAWVYDLIPLEVSIVVDTGINTIEIPFLTFVQKEGLNLMGAECMKKFNGLFPIRFNYDDTWHGNGNMSIQVHPGQDYIVENFNEPGRQDESYYVVATGHGAKTFVGFNEDADIDCFIREIRKSEKKFTSVDYEKYINQIQSFPGIQIMLPAGTIHASGRNQVVLETGSLTVGSYTFKLYDYLRSDLDGKPRPIHSYHGEKVLRKERRTSWIKENLIRPPSLVRKGEGWAEYIVGEHELLYFSLRRLEFEKEIHDDTNGTFHILTLVDGEKVIVQSVENPELRYVQNFLDIVIVPANMGRYVIINTGNQPVCIHKTLLKENQ
jgi:mannose-6-phosphate isomerase class I